MVQKVLKDMVITAELRLQAFAAIQTVKLHYENTVVCVFRCATVENLSLILWPAPFL